MEIEPTTTEEKVITDIHPLKKGKRILVFLADFFFHFMISFLLFNIACAPIGKAITGFNEKNSQHIALTSEMYDHYYKCGILFNDNSFENYDVTAGLEYTYRCFLSYYVIDSEETIDNKYSQYGHKSANEVVQHFFVSIRNNEQTYIDKFNYYNETDKYFTYDSNNKKFSLIPEIKNELYAFYDPTDELGTIGKGYYDKVLNNVYSPLMAEVMSDIETNDLSYPGETHSYLECKNTIIEIETYFANLMTICAYIAHFISWLGYFLIFPLVNKTRKTPAMLMMHIERVDFFSLNHCKRPPYLINALYWLFSSLMGVMFLPSLIAPFNTLFSFRFLIYGTIFSTILSLASLIFLLINQYNRSLIDFLSNNLFLTESEMDEVYRARGYNV